MIALINYGAGNIRSVKNAVDRLGYAVRITSDPDEVLAADTVILPGVGAAADTVAGLKKLNLVEPVRKIIAEDRPFMGICIGMQVLLTATEEGGWNQCLDIFPGMVRKLPGGQKIPHMGWNQVKQTADSPVFKGIPDNSYFYFVHSYYPDPEDKTLVAGETEYGMTFCSVITRGNLVATQFHPEKSGETGLRIFDNFLRNAGEK